MITGGSSPHDHNGARIIELDGSPLESSWVEIVKLLLNSLEVEGTIKTFSDLQFKGFPLGCNFFDY